jgi:4-hydroxybenzoate polyprenyltransferase
MNPINYQIQKQQIIKKAKYLQSSFLAISFISLALAIYVGYNKLELILSILLAIFSLILITFIYLIKRLQEIELAEIDKLIKGAKKDSSLFLVKEIEITNDTNTL